MHTVANMIHQTINWHWFIIPILMINAFCTHETTKNKEQAYLYLIDVLFHTKEYEHLMLNQQ